MALSSMFNLKDEGIGETMGVLFEYEGVRVEQQPGAPVFYLISVKADDLLAWADVPRAKGDYMAGYQRLLNADRTSSVTDYLEKSENNIIPSAVIVAVDEDYVEV